MSGVDMGRLLVLDDDADFGLTVCAMASRAGFEARAATTARDFYRIEAEWRPTHIALDLVMPDIDGVEVMRQLAEQRCAAAIIITSGAGSSVIDAAQRGSIERGLNILGTVAKPFSPAQFRAILQAILPPQAANPAPAPVAKAETAGIVEQALIAALKDRQFRVFYQPKISCSDGRIAGFEALVRWQHPEQGMIRPDLFIPLAESTGLIHELTFQVMEMAFGWLASFGDEAGFLLAVNLSAKSLVDMRFANQVFAASWDKGVNPDRVILEVTETSAMTDPLTTLDLLTRLRIKGFHLSIDDFGVGHSSMIQLARLPFSEMKIDTSFVKNLATSDVSQKIVKGIVGLGHSLGMRITAEGVEDRDALDHLRSIGCDLIQGYFIGRPMDGDAARAWIAAYDGSNMQMDGME